MTCLGLNLSENQNERHSTTTLATPDSANKNTDETTVWRFESVNECGDHIYIYIASKWSAELSTGLNTTAQTETQTGFTSGGLIELFQLKWIQKSSSTFSLSLCVCSLN